MHPGLLEIVPRIRPAASRVTYQIGVPDQNPPWSVRSHNGHPEPRRLYLPPATTFPTTWSKGGHEVNIVTVVCHPRSGSNLLMDLLSSCASVTAVYEIFNFQALDRGPLTEPVERPFDSFSAFDAAKNHDPIGILRALTANKDVELLLLKVFPGHVSDVGLQKLIAGSSAVIQLTRNPLSAWVSTAIASETDRWDNADTSATRVRWDALNFAQSTEKQLNYVLAGRQLAEDSGRPVVPLDYLDVVGAGSPSALWGYLRTFIDEWPSYSQKTHWKLSFTKQDTRVPIERIDNYRETIADLSCVGLDPLIADRPVGQIFDVLPRVQLMRQNLEYLVGLPPLTLREPIGGDQH
jgi:hypothetical protein